MLKGRSSLTTPGSRETISGPTNQAAVYANVGQVSNTLYQPRGDCFKNAGSPCRMIFWVILGVEWRRVACSLRRHVYHLLSVTTGHYTILAIA